MLSLFFPVLVLSMFVVYFECRKFNAPTLLFLISNAVGFLVGALISNLVVSFILGESSLLLTDDRSLFGGGLSWTVLVITTIVVLSKTNTKVTEMAIVPDNLPETNYSIGEILRTLVGPGLLSVGIASFCATIADLFIFVIYGFIGLDSETIPESLFWLAGLIYVIACIGISYSIFALLIKRKNKIIQYEAIVDMSTSVPITVKLWTPNTIGFMTFFFGFPSGILLASINWIRMGFTKKAVYHILGGLVGILIIIVTLSLISGNRGRGVSGLVNLVILFYLNSQIKKDIEVFISNNHQIQNAHWFGGCLISLLMVGLYIFIAFLVVMVLMFLGIPIPE